MIELQRFPNLRHTAGVEDHDLVGEGHRFHLIVGDIDHGAAQSLMQTGDFDTHLDAQGGIEVGKRLIQQENAWLCHQRTTNRHALALTAGEGFRFTLQQMGQLQHFRNLSHPLVNQIFFRAGQLQAKRHIFRNGKVGIECIRLEYHPNAAFCRWDLVHAGVTDKQVPAGNSF